MCLSKFSDVFSLEITKKTTPGLDGRQRDDVDAAADADVARTRRRRHLQRRQPVAGQRFGQRRGAQEARRPL